MAEVDEAVRPVLPSQDTSGETLKFRLRTLRRVIKKLRREAIVGIAGSLDSQTLGEWLSSTSHANTRNLTTTHVSARLDSYSKPPYHLGLPSSGFFRKGPPVMRTFVATPTSVESRWHVIDAETQALGRVATAAARLLQGKHKPTYTPFIDTGDHVVIVNASRVKPLTDGAQGRAEDLSPPQRLRRRPPGGARQGRAEDQSGASRRRSDSRHAAEVAARRRDVPQAEGVRRSGSSARGAETL